MELKQLMKTVTQSIDAEGTGKSRAEALGNALSEMRKTANRDIDGTILKMEPQQVYLLSEAVDTETERFLFMFMPREKTTYTISYRFTVEIRYVPNEIHGRD